MPNPVRFDSAAIRLAALYAAIFVVIGLVLPFWPVWLHHRGLSPAAIAVVLTTGMVVRIVASPAIAFLADRRGERRRPILLLALLSGAAYAGFTQCRDFGPILALTLLSSAVFSSIQPLTDTLSLRVSAARGLDYGRMRLWGSVSFIVASYGGGALLGRFGVDAILWWIVTACVLAAAVAWSIPEAPGSSTRPSPFGGRAALRLLSQPEFLLFLASASLVQASHGVYYAFGTLNWQNLGYPDRLIGLLWGLAVVAEILLFAVSGRAVAWIGPLGLILLGGAGGVVRWVATAFDPPLPALAGLQLLHALTFGATFLGSVHFISRAIPPGLSATAQSILSAASAGIFLGAATLAAGWLYTTFGARAYLGMAAMAGLGSLCAWILERRWSGGMLAAKIAAPH